VAVLSEAENGFMDEITELKNVSEGKIAPVQKRLKG
jgi:hypothetical protein